jgi:hypothetical protein
MRDRRGRVDIGICTGIADVVIVVVAVGAEFMGRADVVVGVGGRLVERRVRRAVV